MTEKIRDTLNVCYESIHKKTMTPEKPIVGVLNSNKPDYLYEGISDAVDLSYEEWVKDCNPSEDEKEEYMGDDSTYLFGFVLNSEGEYEPDTSAEFSAIVSGIYTQVIRSKWVSKCVMCSLCFPHQGDLDNAGDQVTFTLPPDVWGDATHLPISLIESTEG